MLEVSIGTTIYYNQNHDLLCKDLRSCMGCCHTLAPQARSWPQCSLADRYRCNCLDQCSYMWLRWRMACGECKNSNLSWRNDIKITLGVKRHTLEQCNVPVLFLVVRVWSYLGHRTVHPSPLYSCTAMAAGTCHVCRLGIFCTPCKIYPAILLCTCNRQACHSY